MKSLLYFAILFVNTVAVATLSAAPVDTAPVDTAPVDTVIIQIGERQQIKITSNSEDELQTLGALNLNQIMQDIQQRADQTPGDVIVVQLEDSLGNRYLLNDTIDIDSLSLSEQLELIARSAGAVGDTLEKIFNREKPEPKSRPRPRTQSTLMVDFGLNNYLTADGTFPEETNALYAVRPVYSWYIALGGINKTRIAGPLYLDWGANVSWYNFKFENVRTRIAKGDEALTFFEDTRVANPVKSKLAVPYLNVSLVPLLHFGARHRNGFMDYDSDGFRIGVGAYAGYRLGGRTKAVYIVEGDRVRDKNRDSFYLNTWRYGVRLQLGIAGVDVFANYDLNELFVEDRGPELNAFSFGITF